MYFRCKHSIIINHKGESVSSVTSSVSQAWIQGPIIFCPNNYKLQKKLQLSIIHVNSFINGAWQLHNYNNKLLLN